MALILFDFDGVLADTLDDLLQFGQEVCNELGVHHHVVKEDLSTLEVMSFATYGRQLEVPDALIEKFVQRCLEKIAEKESPPAIFTGLADVVRYLSKRHTLGVVTTNSAKNVQAFLAQHGLEDCILAIYGVDQPGSKACLLYTSGEAGHCITNGVEVAMLGAFEGEFHYFDNVR